MVNAARAWGPALVMLSGVLTAVVCDRNAYAQVVIPQVSAGPKRLMTVDDMAQLRSIDSLSVSPDGRRSAIFVRQGAWRTNGYHTQWFVVDHATHALTAVGDGGEMQPAADPQGDVTGDFEYSPSRWSPDGQWIAYLLRRDGEVQLWRSRVDGRVQERLTRNAADVREFGWSEDGTHLYFSAGSPREERRRCAESREREGYRYDEDFNDIHDLQSPMPHRFCDDRTTYWTFSLANRQEREATDAERALLGQALSSSDALSGFTHDEAAPPVAGPDGAMILLSRTEPYSRELRLAASVIKPVKRTIQCSADPCRGVIRKTWWSRDGKRVIFWRQAGINNRLDEFYSWAPALGVVSSLFRSGDDVFRACEHADGRLVCIRETKTLPSHVATLDVRPETKATARLSVVADVNPELRNVRFGRVARIEWDTPKFSWSAPGGRLEGVYPARAYGYILYPPDFDENKSYPVFVDPYVADGFNSSGGGEHLLHVYAASGFIVVNTAFPEAHWGSVLRENGMALLFSADLNFPDLSMLMESTLRGLDVAIARGSVDAKRVGIGGVSTGAAVPLYMLQKHDRIAAISIAGPGWGSDEYYWGTRRGRDRHLAAYGELSGESWAPKPDEKGRAFWKRIDIAENVDKVQAPILMQLAEQEAWGAIRMIRHLHDAAKPYDAYIYRGETHIKWQSAHLHAIWMRNLDWFRFWLQGYEDPDPARKDQYIRWRSLRSQKAHGST